MKRKIQKRLYEILEKGEKGDISSKIFDIFIVSLIIVNIIAIMLETVAPIYNSYRKEFRIFEIFSVIVFTVEYILRVWSCASIPKYSKRFKGRIKYMMTPMLIIDLLAILPFYLPFVLVIDLRVLRALRLLRLFRLFKIGRYSKAMEMLIKSFLAKKEELVITFFVLFILLIISSSMMFYFETDAQPDQFSSIPSALWWGVASLTTVGYGDIYPVTPLGKVFASMIAILGIGFIALPTGIISSAFIEQVQQRKKTKKCPHCGEKIE